MDEHPRVPIGIWDSISRTIDEVLYINLMSEND
jgi:hypothetical protein